jgi:hypothetical protein
MSEEKKERNKRGRQDTHVEPRPIVLHGIQHLLDRTLIHKVPQRLPRRPIDVFRRELPFKDVLSDSRGRAQGRVYDTMHLVERMLAPEKRRIGRGLVKSWRDELCAEGFKDGIEGGGTLRTDGVPFLPYVGKRKREGGENVRGSACRLGHACTRCSLPRWQPAG